MIMERICTITARACTYTAAESRSGVSQGLGWVGKKKKKQVIAVPVWFRWGNRRQLDEEKTEGKEKRESP